MPPAEILSKRTRDSKHFDNGDGTFTAVFGNLLHYESSPGVWEDVDLSFHQVGSDWVADKIPHQVRVSGNAIEATHRATGKGIRFTLPGSATVAGNYTEFVWNGITFRYYVTRGGLKLGATVPTRLGARTYQFTYARLGGAAAITVDADGNLLGDGYILPRAWVLGADGVYYLCGGWSRTANKVTFSFDDSTLPNGAFPYELDPTTTFNVAASGDDGDIWAENATYPPSTTTVHTTATFARACRSWTGSAYRVGVFLARWDTSSLGSGATVTGATFRGYVTDYNNGDGSRSLTADWYSSSNWPIDGADYTSTAQTGALTSYSLSGLSSGDKDITLTNPASGVNTTGYTGIRFHISGSTPTADNYLDFATYDHATYTEPRLIVDYITSVNVTMSAGLTTATALAQAAGLQSGSALAAALGVATAGSLSGVLASGSALLAQAGTATAVSPNSSLSSGCVLAAALSLASALSASSTLTGASPAAVLAAVLTLATAQSGGGVMSSGAVLPAGVTLVSALSPNGAFTSGGVVLASLTMATAASLIGSLTGMNANGLLLAGLPAANAVSPVVSFRAQRIVIGRGMLRSGGRFVKIGSGTR